MKDKDQKENLELRRQGSFTLLQCFHQVLGPFRLVPWKKSFWIWVIYAMKFVISEISPPPFFAFLNFFQKFMTKITVSNANKFAMKFLAPLGALAGLEF